jgi:hypothetical protein
VVVVRLVDLSGCTGLSTPPRVNVQVSKKEVFDADQVQMHAKHADVIERITGGLTFARFPGEHGEAAAMTIPDASLNLCPSACFACFCG